MLFAYTRQRDIRWSGRPTGVALMGGQSGRAAAKIGSDCVQPGPYQGHRIAMATGCAQQSLLTDASANYRSAVGDRS
jgi:hypothetical protein